MAPFHISNMNCRSDLGRHLREGAVSPQDRLCYACNRELPLSYIALIDIYVKSRIANEENVNSARLPTPQSPLVPESGKSNWSCSFASSKYPSQNDSQDLHANLQIDKSNKTGDIPSVHSPIQSFSTTQASSPPSGDNSLDLPLGVRYLVFHEQPKDNYRYVKVTINHDGISESGYVRTKPTAADFYSFGVFDLSSVNFGAVPPIGIKPKVNEYDRFCISKALGTGTNFDSLAISPTHSSPLNPLKYQYIVMKYSRFPDLPSVPGTCGLVLDIMSDFPSYPLHLFTSHTGKLWRYIGDYLFNVRGELDHSISWDNLPPAERQHWVKFFISENRKLNLNRLMEMGLPKSEALAFTPEAVCRAFAAGRFKLNLVLVKFVVYDQEFTERMDQFSMTLKSAA